MYVASSSESLGGFLIGSFLSLFLRSVSSLVGLVVSLFDLLASTIKVELSVPCSLNTFRFQNLQLSLCQVNENAAK